MSRKLQFKDWLKIGAGFMLLIIFLVVLIGVSHMSPVPISTDSPRQEPKEDEKEQVDEEKRNRLQQVELREDIQPSATAWDEVENGKFRVTTLLESNTDHRLFYRKMLDRGAIFVVQNINRSNFLLKGSQQRIPLGESSMDLQAYALDRPRRLARSEFAYLPEMARQPGDTLFLVFPTEIEAKILTQVERGLPEPLSEYTAATLTVSVSGAGYLDFMLNEVTHRQDGVQKMSHRFRGI